jgi:uncharacterized DUF497 family protein
VNAATLLVLAHTIAWEDPGNGEELVEAVRIISARSADRSERRSRKGDVIG